MTVDRVAHSRQSSSREALLEHLFVGELMKRAWLSGPLPIEVMKPQVDDAGYDLVIECSGTLRHIQLKSSFTGSTTSNQKIHIRLGEKISGCVVWVYFDPATLTLGPFLYFGGPPGTPLPDLTRYKTARHTKGDSSGHKARRPNLQVVPKGAFQRFERFAELTAALFGPEIGL